MCGHSFIHIIYSIAVLGYHSLQGCLVLRLQFTSALVGGFVCAEYGGNWKMLHYFARRFFSPKILSAYVEGDSMHLYYVNDLVYRSSRSSSGLLKPEARWNAADRLTVSTENRVDDTNALCHKFDTKRTIHSSAVAAAADDDDVVDDLTVSMSAAESDELHHTAVDDCVVTMQCFQWNSFEPRAQWNITFPEVFVCQLLNCFYLLLVMIRYQDFIFNTISIQYLENIAISIYIFLR